MPAATFGDRLSLASLSTHTSNCAGRLSHCLRVHSLRLPCRPPSAQWPRLSAPAPPRRRPRPTDAARARAKRMAAPGLLPAALLLADIQTDDVLCKE